MVNIILTVVGFMIILPLWILTVGYLLYKFERVLKEPFINLYAKIWR